MNFLPTIANTSKHQNHAGSFIKTKGFTAYQRGFTLLEILAVVLIIGIIVSFATLSVGQSSSHVIQEEVERLNGLLHLASEEAVMQGRELALQFSEDAYSFLELSTENQWIPVGDDVLFRERSFPPEINIDLVIEGAPASFNDEKNLPRVFVLSSGELTPFTLTLSLDEKESYTLEGAIDGKLSLSNAAENGFDG